MIRLDNFTIGYGHRVLLENVFAEFPKGQLTALIGRNGTGKSTLIRALAGLNKDYSGAVYIDNNDISSLSQSTLAKTLAIVTTQRTRISNITCEEVVALGRTPYTDWIGRLRESDHEIINKTLHAVGMEAYATKAMDKMSDGECQRIMIARALAQETPIIILDEPTSYLDMPNRYELCTLLANLAHENNMCVIFSTHELDIALTMTDRIALINTPSLYCCPTNDIINSGLIDTMFNDSNVTYDIMAHRIIKK